MDFNLIRCKNLYNQAKLSKLKSQERGILNSASGEIQSWMTESMEYSEDEHLI